MPRSPDSPARHPGEPLAIDPRPLFCASLFCALFCACAAPPRQEPPPAPPAARALDPLPDSDVGLSFSADAAWLTARGRLAHKGYADVGVLVNDDDDVVLRAGLLREARASADEALILGVGLGAYAAQLDGPDETVSALVLEALGGYVLPSELPARCTARVSIAPDVTTFGGGDSLVDFVAGVEVGVGSFASALLGYRVLELGLASGGNHTVERGAHFGVRIGF